MFGFVPTFPRNHRRSTHNPHCRPRAVSVGRTVAEVATTLEDAGFRRLSRHPDHPAPDARWLEGGGHHALDPSWPCPSPPPPQQPCDCRPYIFVAGYRNPFLSAKSALSLDLLSGGRLTLGVAAGYLKPEFGALGVSTLMSATNCSKRP